MSKDNSGLVSSSEFNGITSIKLASSDALSKKKLSIITVRPRLSELIEIKGNPDNTDFFFPPFSQDTEIQIINSMDGFKIKYINLRKNGIKFLFYQEKFV